MPYYSIILYNVEKDITEVGLVKAESHYKAEEKGKEWAKLWGHQASFHSANYLNMGAVDKGEIIGIA